MNLYGMELKKPLAHDDLEIVEYSENLDNSDIIRDAKLQKNL